MKFENKKTKGRHKETLRLKKSSYKLLFLMFLLR